MRKSTKAKLKKLGSSVGVGLLSVWGVLTSFPALAANLDLTTWEKLGDVNVIDANEANLSTDGLFDDDFDLGAGNGDFNFSGDPAAIVGFGQSLESFLNIEASLLDVEGIAYEGSAIKTTVTVNQGDILKFDWQFFTNETSSLLAEGLHPFNDYGFILVNGEIQKLADFQQATTDSSLFNKETELGSFEYAFATGGTYTIALGVIDVDDFSITSALSVKNVHVQTVPVSVPEPSTRMGLAAMLVFGFGVKKSLRKKSTL